MRRVCVAGFLLTLLLTSLLVVVVVQSTDEEGQVSSSSARGGGSGAISLKHVRLCDMHNETLHHVLSKPHRLHERRRIMKQHPAQAQAQQAATSYYDILAEGLGPATLVNDDEKEDSFSRELATESIEEELVLKAEEELVVETAELYGSVVQTGYYAMELHLGTPSQPFQVIVDTGSTIAYVPCVFCRDKCGKHINLPFDPKASSTASFVNCISAQCDTFCGSRRCSCRPSLEFLADIVLPMMSVCSYSRRYQEQSSSNGLLLTDTLTLDNLGGQYEFGFGCETLETGAIYHQKADGVVGIGNNPSSLINQLVAQEAMANSFSICMGGSQGGGSIFLGDQGAPSLIKHMQYARLQKDERNPEFYSVKVESIKLGGNTINVPRELYSEGYGSVIDTGTTFIYLPEQAYVGFNQILLAEMEKHKDVVMKVPGPDPRYPGDVCFASTADTSLITTLADTLMHLGRGSSSSSSLGLEEEEMLRLFPTLTLEMAGESVGESVHVEFGPFNYLFRTRFSSMSRGFCVGVYNNGNSGTLLGSVMMRNYLVNFDLQNERIGFATYDCDGI
jgi:hypothetical protein